MLYERMLYIVEIHLFYVHCRCRYVLAGLMEDCRLVEKPFLRTRKERPKNDGRTTEGRRKDGGSVFGLRSAVVFAALFDFEPLFPSGEVEEPGVGGGLPGEEGADGNEDEGGDPHAYGTHGAFAD